MTVEVEYTRSGVPKQCRGCGHPFHPAGNCRALEAGRCPCEHNMAVHLPALQAEPQQGITAHEVCGCLDGNRCRLTRDLEAAQNDMERVVTILTPLFVKAQDQDSPDEEAIGGALDVLTGWFGQRGKPLRKLDELEDKLKAARQQIAELEREGSESEMSELIRAVSYWQGRALDHAKAYDEARASNQVLDDALAMCSDANRDLSERLDAQARELEAATAGQQDMVGESA